MNNRIIRFFTIFVFMFTCFMLTKDSGILTLLELPNLPLVAVITSFVFAYLTYEANPWITGLICCFVFIANTQANAQMPIFPDPATSFAIAITLAIFPRFRAMMEK